MKKNSLLSIILISFLLSACGRHSNNAGVKAADSSSNTTKADTAVVAGNQKNIPNDSLSGDPASKGNADPTAKLPKK